MGCLADLFQQLKSARQQVLETCLKVIEAVTACHFTRRGPYRSAPPAPDEVAVRAKHDSKLQRIMVIRPILFPELLSLEQSPEFSWQESTSHDSPPVQLFSHTPKYTAGRQKFQFCSGQRFKMVCLSAHCKAKFPMGRRS